MEARTGGIHLAPPARAVYRISEENMSEHEEYEWPAMWSRLIIEAERRDCTPEFLMYELLRDARVALAAERAAHEQAEAKLTEWQQMDDEIRARLRRVTPTDKARDIAGSIEQLAAERDAVLGQVAALREYVETHQWTDWDIQIIGDARVEKVAYCERIECCQPSGWPHLDSCRTRILLADTAAAAAARDARLVAEARDKALAEARNKALAEAAHLAAGAELFKLANAIAALRAAAPATEANP
jgi:hypothetical protein